MIREFIYFYSSVASILSFLSLLVGIILYKRESLPHYWFLIICIIFGFVLFSTTYFWPEYMLPESKRYIDWVSHRSGPMSGSFQDFDGRAEDFVDKLWADPSAELHQGTQPSTISAKVIPEEGENNKYSLSVVFNSQGYGANITIRCKNSIPANAEKASNLVFTARFIPEDTSQEYLGLKIRIFDQDGEVWFLSESPLPDYDKTPDITIRSEENFTDYSINLSAYRNRDEQRYKKFKHDGNAWGGDLVPSFGNISRITFDLLPLGTRGELLLDNIRFE